jgi:cysteine synthase A
VTGNLEDLPVDDALRISDEDALEVVFNRLIKDGLVLGGSTGINVAAAIQLGRKLGPDAVVATILCDSGTRYQSKLFNPDFLRSKGLPIPPWMA